jgi:hypothetical protein
LFWIGNSRLRNIEWVIFSAVSFCAFDVMRRRHFERAKLRKLPHARDALMGNFNDKISAKNIR